MSSAYRCGASLPTSPTCVGYHCQSEEVKKRNKLRLLRMWRLRRHAQLYNSAHNRVSTHIKNGNWRG